MNLAAPPRPASPAIASVAPDPEPVTSDVEPALPVKAPKVEPSRPADPAVPIDDPRKFAPNKELNEEYKRENRLSIRTLREGAGTDFEAPAAVCKGIQKNALRRLLPFIFDERDFTSYGEILRYVVIQSNFCYVYAEETDLSPIYVIPLGSLLAVKEDPKSPNPRSFTVSPLPNTNMSKSTMTTVLLTDAKGALAYQFTFDNSSDTKRSDRFIAAVENVNMMTKKGDKETSYSGMKVITDDAKTFRDE
mmetsp:Transcript_16699/g.23668  ORF Transcript_16699/g.23668 Transcript_16699/m.23668 type:complete len:248 (-) Transcript_16699:184-927(-)